MKLDNPVCKTVASVLVGNFGAGCVFIEAVGRVGDCLIRWWEMARCIG